MVELVHRYDDTVPVGSAEILEFTVTEKMEGPVFLYYELTNFYQNHRRYVKSRDDDQLALGNGISVGSGAYSGNCDPWYESEYTSTSDETVDKQLYPCGLVARSVFNDTFTTAYQASSSSNSEFVSLDESPGTICWSQDVEKKFNQANPTHMNNGVPLIEAVDMWLLKTFPPQVCLPTDPTTPPTYIAVNTVTTSEGMEIVDCDFSLASPTCNFAENACTNGFAAVANPAGWGLDNGHFINWMRTAGLSTFRKLHGKIDQTFYPGDVIHVGVQSNFPVSSYQGTKSVVLSTVTWAGGKNSFLGIGYIVVGGLSIIFTIVYAILHYKQPRRLIDIDYLDWGENH